MHIRKAKCNDLADIMKIYRAAQDFMIESGNPNQWRHSYPGEDLIKEDIRNGICCLVCCGDTPHGVFALFSGEEPTYSYIEDGKWLNGDEYLTIHRIASDGEYHGIFKCASDYCKGISDNIRIDTHHDNIIMQRQIEKNGFRKCGRIYVADGSPRLAYQWSKNE